MAVRSALAAEEKNGLLAEQVPEPPGRIEPQRRAPGVERHRLLHLHPDGGAELAEILDGAVVDVGRVVPAVRQDIGLRHMPGAPGICRRPISCRTAGTTRPTSTTAPSRISASSAPPSG